MPIKSIENLPQTLPDTPTPSFAVVELVSALHDELITDERKRAHYADLVASEQKDLDYLAPPHIGDAEVDRFSISGAEWDLAVDPSMPTIGMRYDVAVTGSSVIASAARRMRLAGLAVPNVVILPTAILSDEGTPEYPGAKGLFTPKAGIVAPGDIVKFGEAPRPIQIHATPSTGFTVISKPRDDVRMINTEKSEKLIWDKACLRERLAGSKIVQDPMLAANIDASDPHLDTLLSRASKTGQPIVIKPLNQDFGNGVFMFDPQITDLSDARMRLALYPPHEKLIVERWLQSRRLYHPETGVRQDWNLRGIIAGGEFAGGFARVGVYGTPVNLATDAVPRNLTSVLEATGLDSREIGQVYDRLQHVSQEVYRATDGANIMGLDAVVLEDASIGVIETNGERSGGLANSMLGPNREVDWEPAYNVVTGLSKQLFAGRKRKIYDVQGKRAKFLQNNDIAHLFGLVRGAPDPDGSIEKLMAAIANTDEFRELLPAEGCVKIEKDGSNHPVDMVEKQFRELIEQGDMSAAIAVFDDYLDKIPPALSNQNFAASVFIQEVVEKLPGDNIANIFTLRPEGYESVRPYAHAAFFFACKMTGIDLNAISLGTRQKMIRSTADSIASKTRIVHGYKALPEKEAALLIPAMRIIDGYRAIELGDDEMLEEVLIESLRDPCDDDVHLLDHIAGNDAFIEGADSSRPRARALSAAYMKMGMLQLPLIYVNKGLVRRDEFESLYSEYVSGLYDKSDKDYSPDETSDQAKRLLVAAVYILVEDFSQAGQHLEKYQHSLIPGKKELLGLTAMYLQTVIELGDQDEQPSESTRRHD